SGYLKSEINIQLTVDGSFINPTEPIAVVVNCPNEIILHKVNTEGRPLEGAAFALINAYGEQVMAAVSDENGIVRFTKVPYGDYTLSETQAPNGYNLMEDIHLTVDASWTKPVEYTGVDIPNHYGFIKVDNRGNPLAGVKFVLEDSEGDYLRELVSDDDGVVHVDNLTQGSYIIRETEALEGFNKSDETISVVIDEHYAAPVELYRFVNYSGIQTGFEMEMTPVMWAGVVLAVAGAALLVGHAKHTKGKGKGRKRNLKQRR
ncbi:MAG: SpaA isopeptide-forming pilin-related protein, partial [Clostridia bacterium]